MQVLIKFQVIETSIRAKRIINFKVVVLQDIFDDTPPAVLLADEGGYSFFFTGRTFCRSDRTGQRADDDSSRKTSALGDQFGPHSSASAHLGTILLNAKAPRYRALGEEK